MGQMRIWGVAAVLCLALPGSAWAHETGLPHVHTEEHGDPDRLLPDTLITQPVAQAEFGSVEQQTFDGGTAPETWCGTESTTNDTANQVVASTTAHYKLVYAYASDQTNRFNVLKDRLQATVSLLQRYMAVQSDGKKAIRWDMGTSCGPQYVDITVVPLPQARSYYVPSGSPNFTRLRDDVFTALGGVGAPRNVAIYGDGLRGTNGVAGQGTMGLTNDTMATFHNNGGVAAVTYGPQTLPTGTYIEPAVMMHEIGHNLGAVQDAAPHSTLAGHCHDEQDLMCYQDFGPQGQADDMVVNCSTIAGDVNETLDCGRDDYFNPLPAQGSYLDLNWNSYAVAHLAPCSSELVDSCGITGTAGDGTKPTNTTPVPASRWYSGWSPTLTGTDSESTIDAYQWKYGAHGSALGATQHTQQVDLTGQFAGQVNLYDRVRDSAGNWSAWRWDPVFIDSSPPAATVTCPSTWSTTTAPTCSYSVTDAGAGLASVATQRGSDPIAAGGTSGTLVATADAQTIRARGTDHVGNVGNWGSDTARWDRTDPSVSVTCLDTWGIGSTTCHVNASDAASGIDTLTWRVGSGSTTSVQPNTDFTVTVPGEQTVTVVATDVAGRTNQATALSRVSESGAPSGTNNTVTTNEDTAHAFTAAHFGFSDPDVGQAFDSVRIDTLPATGSLTSSGAPVAAGSSYAPASLAFAPPANACGPTYASFTFSVRDSSGTYDPTPNTMTVAVTCVDDAPTAVNDSPTVTEDAGATTINVLANDGDVDGGATSVVSKTDAAHGTVVINGGGASITYTPAANYCGPDSFTYTLNGGSTATVNVTVNCIDDAPVAVGDPRIVAEDASATTFDVLTNDTDVDGGSKAIVSRGNALHGTATHTASDVTYTPAANYCGPDSFTYTLNGGSTATVSITVTCTDDAPSAVNDSATVTEDAGATVNVLTNDTDTDGGAKTVASKTDPAHGTVTIPAGGGAVTYTPAANYCGPDSFTYTLNGGSTASVNVTVNCVDDAPVAVGDSRTVAEDSGSTTFDVRGNDTDVDGGTKSITSTGLALHGTVAVTNSGADLTYAPEGDYCGPDSFTYTLNGGSTATVSVTVTCVDDAPIAIEDSTGATEDEAVAVDVTSNDADVDDGMLAVESTTNGAHGTTTIASANWVHYTPDANWCGADSFTYTLNGGSTATVNVTVACVDDAPAAVNDSLTVARDASATAVDVRANDTDVDGGTKSIASKTDPAHGAVAITNGGDDLTYTPAGGYCGPDSFTYTLNGGSTATVNVTVTCPADASPVAVNDSATVAEDAAATAIGVLGNDTDTDGGPKTIQSKANGTRGAVAITGSGAGLTYKPDADYCGSDTFTYTLNGGSTATVNVTITCVDDAPRAVNDSATVAEDDGVIIDVRANDTDVDGGSKTIASSTQPAHGVQVVMNDAIAYRPAANYCGADSFTYTLSGGSTATVNVTVTCIDEPPAATTPVAPSADAVPPATKIQDPPKKKLTTSGRTAKLTLKLLSSEPGSTFRCKVDKGSFKLCPRKATFKLKPGKHTLTVVAVDAAGNRDPSPMKLKVEVIRRR